MKFGGTQFKENERGIEERTLKTSQIKKLKNMPTRDPEME